MLENKDKMVILPLRIVKMLFEDIFGSKNYFDLEIPESYKDGTQGETFSEYDRVVSGYEHDGALGRLVGTILTVIDASVDKEKAIHVKSLIKQLYYQGIRDLNDDMFNLIDRYIKEIKD